MIWFLAPTVLLCGQQHHILQLQLPYAKSRLLSGIENINTWNAEIWRPILQDVRVVVATYQVLYDALSHGFMTMERLALIVFDEGMAAVPFYLRTINLFSTQLHWEKPWRKADDRLLPPSLGNATSGTSYPWSDRDSADAIQ